MEEIVLTQWNGDMSFTSDIDGYNIVMDASEEHGGNHRGPRPKPLLLAALAGCTGMDVMAILEKMRVVPSDFKISVSGDSTDEHPKYYHKIHIIYEFWGKELPADKIEKAINLSRDRYCSVNRMLRESSEITWEMLLHD